MLSSPWAVGRQWPSRSAKYIYVLTGSYLLRAFEKDMERVKKKREKEPDRQRKRECGREI